MGIDEVRKAANLRRTLRWARQNAQDEERKANHELVALIAKWQKTEPEKIKLSNVACRKAPADLGCVYVASFHPLSNKCVFGCGGTEEDLF
jgi:hypothetical protein